MINIETYMDIADAIGVTDITLLGEENAFINMFSDIPALKDNLNLIALANNSIENKKSSDIYLINLYNSLTPLRNYNNSNINLLKQLVLSMQIHVTAHYSSVNTFLSDNHKPVMKEFADLSASVGYIIDPENIRDPDVLPNIFIWGGYDIFTDDWLDGLYHSGMKKRIGLFPNEWSFAWQIPPNNSVRHDATIKLCEKLKAEDIYFIPGGLTFASDAIVHPYSQWFDSSWWEIIAEEVDNLTKLTSKKDINLDFEPYGMVSPDDRYPDFAEFPALTIAMKPLIDLLIEENIRPWVTPGDFPPAYTGGYASLYAPAAVLAEVMPCTLLSEATYGWPDNPSSVTIFNSWDKRNKLYPPLGHRYIPGFYGSAWNNPTFKTVLDNNSINEQWLFFRVATDRFYQMWEDIK